MLVFVPSSMQRAPNPGEFGWPSSSLVRSRKPRICRTSEALRTKLHLNAAASVRPDAPARVYFAFDEGYFEWKQSGLPRVPYPVPFKLLGKEAEGYIDTTYLSDTLRISTGNKGTQFVLTRNVP